jgi:hypothetical protein
MSLRPPGRLTIRTTVDSLEPELRAVATDASPIWKSKVAGQSSEPSAEPPRPAALPPLTTRYGVRQELIDDALAFMDEYDDVFRSLAQ